MPVKHNMSAILSVLAWSAALACTPRQTTTDLKITNGVLASDSDFPAVVQLTNTNNRSCTGTFISDSLLVTAAHCLGKPTNDSTGIGEGGILYGSRPSVRAYTAVPYPGHKIGPLDLAVIDFGQGAAPDVAGLATRQPNAGDGITIVGFGYNDTINKTGIGTKRVGYNTIGSVDGGMIDFTGVAQTTSGTPDGSNAASSNGDSGGPLFIDGNALAGTTSGGHVDASGNKVSEYVNLMSDASQALLQQAQSGGVESGSGDLDGTDGQGGNGQGDGG
jgi:V8-like Glu-specific endopeptidase